MKYLLCFSLAFTSGMSAYADNRIDATVNSVSLSGEGQLIVNVASSGIPTPMNAYVIAGIGPNGVLATVGDVKAYAALFLTAKSTGKKVDITFALGASPDYKPLLQSAVLKN
jgi:hypothetical protein